ncbi:isoprenylcysteine carboxylmethyltransferase family protein [Corallococcus sp. AS-1-6]|uniref:methyltransferase family protein n=1 Tax=Corallococcus sp. AS-1-6 TaxID=2874599 RepID=UPI001CC1999F|nr:isoprenylcysteine carboxylmethyltransferase family protein [Corallococcus sp. AS-1-6]MBZ4374085.1 isoprenylcysteine carboxylmethyltransferase family protein [Corallococcus sp. AS-1-6]
MDVVTFTRPALPAATLAFLLFAMVLPSVRLRRRTGRPALVLHRSGPPLQRVIGAGMALFMGAIVLWSAAHLAFGEQALGVWRVPAVLRWSGWALVAVGFAFTVRAQVEMGASWRIGIDSERTELVTWGLFGVVRNPIFSGMLVVVTGMALAAPSAWTVMGWLDYVLLVSLQVRLEEDHLLGLHGAAYQRYAARVGRFLPGVGRLEAPGLDAAPRITV